jgi:hypothetical protein
VFKVFEQCCKSALFNADPDQDLTSCFDAGPDPDPDPSLKLGQIINFNTVITNFGGQNRNATELFENILKFFCGKSHVIPINNNE